MKEFVKNIKNWLIVGVSASFVIVISLIIYTKSRQTTNPTPTDDGAGMYVTNGNTLTAAKRNNLVNRSTFRAYLGSAQNISTNSYTKVNMNTEEFDTNNEFDTTTYKFTPKRAGKYFLTATCYFNSITSTYWAMGYIYKNWASNWGWTFIPGGSTTANISTVNVVVDANGTTDYFETYCRTSSAATTLLNWKNATYFAGFRVE